MKARWTALPNNEMLGKPASHSGSNNSLHGQSNQASVRGGA
jgi:hypothetical protein